MVGAFAEGSCFPRPDLLVCSVGATCDDFTAIAQHVEHLGFPVFWWEIPHRADGQNGSAALRYLQEQLQGVRNEISRACGVPLTDEALSAGIRNANHVRTLLRELRRCVFTAERSAAAGPGTAHLRDARNSLLLRP